MTQIQPSIAEYYHEQTKYDPESLRQKSQYLDWNKQPVPFKEYKIGSNFELKYYLNKKLEDFSNNSSQQWWWRLSELLFCSYGLTAKIPSMGST
ncbi:SagB-type dehydrogenase domain-containing protein, partial [Cylindrospermopsis raciborskii S14]